MVIKKRNFSLFLGPHLNGNTFQSLLSVTSMLCQSAAYFSRIFLAICFSFSELAASQMTACSFLIFSSILGGFFTEIMLNVCGL
jgi:hypothetical protein